MSGATMTWRVVVVDDQDDIRFLVRIQLDADPRLEVVGDFGHAHEAVAAMAALRPDVVVLDQLLGDGETGVGVYQSILDAAPNARIVFHVGDPNMIDGSVPATAIVPKGGDIVAAVLRAAISTNTRSPHGDAGADNGGGADR